MTELRKIRNDIVDQSAFNAMKILADGAPYHIDAKETLIKMKRLFDRDEVTDDSYYTYYKNWSRDYVRRDICFPPGFNRWYRSMCYCCVIAIVKCSRANISKKNAIRHVFEKMQVHDIIQFDSFRLGFYNSQELLLYKDVEI